MDYGRLPEWILCYLLRPNVERKSLTNFSGQGSWVRQEHTPDQTGKHETLRSSKIRGQRQDDVSRDLEAQNCRQRAEATQGGFKTPKNPSRRKNQPVIDPLYRSDYQSRKYKRHTPTNENVGPRMWSKSFKHCADSFGNFK